MRKIVFLSGTRADYGKIKSLLKALDSDKQNFSYSIFVCGMHLLENYGKTYLEIIKDGFNHIFLANTASASPDISLSQTIMQFSVFVKENKPDLIVVHGDRLEALAGAIVGALNNIKVAHIEGGEVSGTIDESIRHSVTKLAHIHFSANKDASKNLIQLGENPDCIFEIGSPDIDIMMENNLPSLEKVANYYNIAFIQQNKPYAIAIFHPITTALEHLHQQIMNFLQALVASQKNYIIIYPNNDAGSDVIIQAIIGLKNHPNFAIYPSIKFEKFLTLLKNADFIIGNSSAGIREAPIYGVPTINVGKRQQNRTFLSSIIHTDDSIQSITNAIANIKPLLHANFEFGKGDSAMRFLKVLQDEKIWNLDIQKRFFNL